MFRIKGLPQGKRMTDKEAPKQNQTVDVPLSNSLDENIIFFSSLYKDSSDVVLHSFSIENKKAAVIYIEG